MAIPKGRTLQKPRRAVLVASSGAAALLVRLAASAVQLLKKAAGLLGTTTVGVLLIGLAAWKNSRIRGVHQKKGPPAGKEVAPGGVQAR
jgi:hypothetical protein